MPWLTDDFKGHENSWMYIHKGKAFIATIYRLGKSGIDKSVLENFTEVLLTNFISLELHLPRYDGVGRKMISYFHGTGMVKNDI